MNTRTWQVGSRRTDETRSHPTPRPSRRPRAAVLGVGLWASSFLAPMARGAEPGGASGGELARLQAEIARLTQEQREQRALIFQLMQADQQRYDLLLKFLQSGGAGTAPGPVPPLPSLTAPSAAAAAPPPTPTAETLAAPAARAGRVTGRVHFAGAPVEAYVYVDGLRVPMKTNTIEIHQKNKQFSPRVAVIPLGTKVFFPNDDTIVHNVFSASAEQAFDLGTVKAGDKPSPVVMTKPGPLEILQHPRKDAGRRPGGAQPSLGARRAGRYLRPPGRAGGCASAGPVGAWPAELDGAGGRHRQRGDGHVRRARTGWQTPFEQGGAGIRVLWRVAAAASEPAGHCWWSEELWR